MACRRERDTALGKRGWRLALAGAEGDASLAEIVRRELHSYFDTGENTDVMLAHFARNMGSHYVTVIQLNAKHGNWKRFDTGPLHFDMIFFSYTATALPLLKCPRGPSGFILELAYCPNLGNFSKAGRKAGYI